MTALNAATFSEFVQSHKYVVIHFWASWNRIDDRMKLFLETELPAELRDLVVMAAIDTEVLENHELMRQHKVINLPFLEFYRAGTLISAMIGLEKDKVRENLRQLVATR